MSRIENARRVLSDLQVFVARVDDIMNLLGEKPVLSPSEREHVRELLISLKADLKTAAKHQPVNEFEDAYFCPAVRSASANLTVPVNSHPIRSAWFSCLYGVRIDLSHLLSQLEDISR